MKSTYDKIKENTQMPVAVLSYTYKDFDGIIHPFNTIRISFRDSDEENIRKMEAIKKKYDSFFMFFNNSDEGVKFWDENVITIKPKDN